MPRVSLKVVLGIFLVTQVVASGIVYDGVIADNYDFVILGGGLAGLVLASRLSEDSNHTVLVLEAGASGDLVKSSIDVPSNAYYSSLIGTSYDWQFQTAPQTNLNGRVLPWPRGKTIGGSTAVNGMYLVRPSSLEVNAWQSLLGNMTGASAWSWDSLFAAMKKSETFTPPSQQIQQQFQIQYDLASHGTSGPLHYSYPGYLLSIIENWTATLDWIGVPPSPDANGGAGWGAFIATSSINPSNWTRSYSRSAYIDPLPPRPNLAILPNATVTRIIFNGTVTNPNGLVATAVEYATSSAGVRNTVRVNKEVIVAGGAIGSPSILMHSGVGPRDVLSKAGVPIKVSLPGVGQHLQDHLSTQVVFMTTAETAAQVHANTTLPGGSSARLGSFINSAIAYANITDLLGDYAPTFHTTDVNGQLTTSLANLVPSSDPSVKAGYEAIYKTTSDQILLTRAGQVELLLSLTGTSVGGDQSLAIQAALQHPFSQGQLYIINNDPFTYPVIDPAYLSHPADVVLLREGLKLARKIGMTQPLNSSILSEISPGSRVQTDPQWDAWLATQVGTEYHPSCTCAMLPKELGGVVDASLKVYGLANVRVADSSIYPIEFAAHLMAPTYGVAEQAAIIIRAQYNGLPNPATVTPGSTPTRSPTSTTPSSSGTSTASAKSGSELSMSRHMIGTIVVAIFTALVARKVGLD